MKTDCTKTPGLKRKLRYKWMRKGPSSVFNFTSSELWDRYERKEYSTKSNGNHASFGLCWSADST